ncbi:hypothetical protein PTSG_11910 [Salpingoeca rosetta]|uniref:Uncharacterized protein n=1 Tax=Salpingoeca rosetta (strain ATCC 50818 / BSB-021) TaxID=946362 RepID=F2U335_SALR5|nr:uncharacterized protein PTSG_11910 [Salpingoeca rosetta]EGD82029.1 hypothetical protein PTSG_11910 [Salpingoeca rosetta]|eukprot:XP_004996212.1 hypothetical protein PTSG_11910 [Salpingoeca rosetta]
MPWPTDTYRSVQATLERAGVNVQSLQVFPDLCSASVDVVADSEETFRSLLPLPIDTAASACRLEARHAPLHRIVVTCTLHSKPTSGRDIVQAVEMNFGGKAKLVPIPQSLKDTLSRIHPFASTRITEQEQEQGAQQQDGGGGSEAHDVIAKPTAKDGDGDSKSSKSSGASSETTLQRVFVLETTDTLCHLCLLCYPNDVHVAVLDPKLGGLLSDLVDAFNKGSVAKDLDVLAAVTMGNRICFTGSTAVPVWSQAKLLAGFLAPAFHSFARSDRVLGDDKIMEHVLNDYGLKLGRYPTPGLLPYAGTAHGAVRDVWSLSGCRPSPTPRAYTHVRPGRRGAMLLEYSLYYYLDQDRERGLSYINSTIGANIKSQTTISVTGMQYRFLDSQLLELARKFRVYVRKPSAEDRDACASSVPVTVEGMQRQLTAFNNAVWDTLKEYLCHVLGLPVIDTSHVPEMSEADVTFLKRKLFNYLTKASRTLCRSKDSVVSYVAPQDVIGTPSERNVWMAGRRDLMQTVIPTMESTFRTIAHIRPTRHVCQVPMSVTKELKRLRKKALVLMPVIPQARALLRQLQMLLLPLLLATMGRQPVDLGTHAVLEGLRKEMAAASEVLLPTTCERLFPAKVKQAVWEVELYQYHAIGESLPAVQLHAKLNNTTAAACQGPLMCWRLTAVPVWSQAKLLAGFLAPAFHSFARSDRVLGDDKIMEHVLNDYGLKLGRYPTPGLLPYAGTAHGAVRDVWSLSGCRPSPTPRAYTHVRPGRRGAMLLEYSLYYYLDQDRERGLSYINSTIGANIKSQTTISVTGMQYRFLDSQLLELARKFRVYVRKPSAEDRDACASSVPVTVEGMQRQLTAFNNAVWDTLKEYLCHMTESDVTFLKRKLFNYLTKTSRTLCRSKDGMVSYVAPQDVIGWHAL